MRRSSPLVALALATLVTIACRRSAPENIVRPTADLALASASADASVSGGGGDAGALPPLVIAAQMAGGPYPSLAALCASVVAASPKTTCKPFPAPTLVAVKPYLAIAAVALGEDAWFTKIHPVVITAAGFHLAPHGEEAAAVASTDMATTITVRIVDAHVEDVVPGGAPELVVHLSVLGTIALYDTATRKFAAPSPSSAAIGTIVCGIGPTDTLSCTDVIFGEVAHDSATPPPPPRLTLDDAGSIVAVDAKTPLAGELPAREFRFP